MRRPRLASVLLTLGLLAVGWVCAWHMLEVWERESGGLRVPDGMALEPYDTLRDRIRATWLPGDRLRAALLGGALLVVGAGAWRAWRSAGGPRRVVRSTARVLAVLGATGVLVGIVLARTGEPEMDCAAYVDDAPAVSGRVRPIGHQQVLYSRGAPGAAWTALTGALVLGGALLLGLLTLLLPPQPPGAASAGDRLGPEGPRRRSMAS